MLFLINKSATEYYPSIVVQLLIKHLIQKFALFLESKHISGMLHLRFGLVCLFLLTLAHGTACLSPEGRSALLKV